RPPPPAGPRPGRWQAGRVTERPALTPPRATAWPSRTGRSSASRSSLDPGRPALCKRLHLGLRRHADVAVVRRQQRAVCPAEAQRFLRRPAGNQSIDDAGREPVSAADPVEYVELTRRADVLLAVEPHHGRPVVAVGR